MKTNLALLGGVSLLAACSSSQNMTYRTRPDPNASAYIWETGQQQHAAVDWNRKWGTDQYALASGVAEAPALAPAVAPSTPITTAAAPVVTPAEGGTAATGGAIISGGEGRLEVVDQAEIALHKEELVLAKREVGNGGVIIRKTVQTENVSQPLELRREEYTVERVPASEVRDRASVQDLAWQGREIYIALTREEPVMNKRVVLTEKVHVGKKIETDRPTVSHAVRSEDIEIVKNPDLSDRRFSGVPRHPAPSWQGGASSAGQAVDTAAAERLGDTADLQLAREELNLGKREVENGGVLLRKTIRSQDASQAIDLRREEFVIDRAPLNQQADSADFRNREIRVDLTREEPVVSTRDMITEYIRVRKNMQTETQTVGGSIRKESLEIVKLTDNVGRPAAMIDRPATGQGGTTPAVQSGVSSYTAKQSETGKDQAISGRVKGALTNGSLSSSQSVSSTSYPNIDVSTKDGKVTLRGAVNSETEKKEIAKRVKEISGVRSVKNELWVSNN